MRRWVVVKSPDVASAFDGRGGGDADAQVLLYWGRPMLAVMPASTWVWYSGLCPYVSVFSSAAHAEREAKAFGKGQWQLTGVRAMRVDHLDALDAGLSGAVLAAATGAIAERPHVGTSRR